MKGHGDTQDDLRKAEKAQAQIALALGTETRKRILSDSTLRNATLLAWFVEVPPKCGKLWSVSLPESLPVLVSKIVEALASTSGHSERTQVADGRCVVLAI